MSKIHVGILAAMLALSGGLAASAHGHGGGGAHFVALGGVTDEDFTAGLGCGFLPEPLARPHVEAGRLVLKETQRPPQKAELHFAWRRLPRGARGQMGQALKWWIEQLSHGHTQASLLDDHSEPY